jgi:hypothetical protein
MLEVLTVWLFIVVLLAPVATVVFIARRLMR